MREFYITKVGNVNKDFFKIHMKTDTDDKDYFHATFTIISELKRMGAVIAPGKLNEGHKRGLFSFYIYTKSEEKAQQIIDEFLIPSYIMKNMTKAV